jgi:hypothetical protein
LLETCVELELSVPELCVLLALDPDCVSEPDCAAAVESGVCVVSVVSPPLLELASPPAALLALTC